MNRAPIPIIFFLLAACLFAGSTAADDSKTAQDSVEMIASVEARGAAQIARLEAAGFAVEEIKHAQARVRFRRRDLEKLKNLELPFEILVDDLRARHFRNAGKACEPCGQWRDPDWMTQQAADCAADHPDICAVYDLGESAGGRPIVAVKISDNVLENENEAEVLFEGSIHGDEVVGGELNVFLMNYLTDNFGVVPQVNYLIEEREIWFVFPTNPDGLCACSRYNDNLVDLNRDNGYAWRGMGSSPSPYSQPETKALHSLIRQHSFAFQTSWHGGDLAFVHPWSYLSDAPPDSAEHESIGGEYLALHPEIAEMTQGFDFYGYGYAGSTKDAAYGACGSMAWTIELSELKAPDFAEYEYFMNANLDPALLLMQLAGDQGIRGVFTDAETGDPVAALVEIDDKMMAWADGENGDLHRFALPGEYDITISANGYAPEVLEAVVVPEHGTLDISTALEKDESPAFFAQRLLYYFSSADTQTGDQGFYVLGRPDGRSYPLGVREDLAQTATVDSFMVLDLGLEGIADEDGADIAVYDGNALEAESYAVFISTGDEFGPWAALGEGEGGAAFDLAAAGADSARFLRIEHRETGAARDGDGLEIDAVGSLVNGAGFTADPVAGAAPLGVRFTDQSLTAPAAWLWDFGDGLASAEQHPSHTYNQSGTFSVNLTIQTPFGQQEISRQNYIQVYDAPPVASFDADVKSGYPPLSVQFQNFSEGQATGYEWDMGDGSISDAQAPAHVYESAGAYTVSLRVTGPGGEDESRWENMINVQCPPPEADFTFAPSSGEIPLSVAFEDATPAAPGCEGTFEWDFGDGRVGQGAQIEHIYTEPGLYSVSMTATTPGGSDRALKSNIIGAGIEDGDDDSADDDDSTIYSGDSTTCANCDDDDDNGGCCGW